MYRIEEAEVSRKLEERSQGRRFDISAASGKVIADLSGKGRKRSYRTISETSGVG
jgi:hypothetical protein